jgi:proline iminopeptidase
LEDELLISAKKSIFSATTSQSCTELFVNTDKADLYCRVIGKGAPLIIVHGGPGLSMDYLLPKLDKLAEDHLLIYYDQRGNGKSTGEVNNQTMRLDLFVEDLRAIQQHFGYQKIGLLGHSWGAYLAMQYATQFPDQINQLIILNSIPISFSPALGHHEAKQPDPYEAMIEAVITSPAFANNDAKGMIQIYENTLQNFFYDPALVSQLNLGKMTANQLKNCALIHQIFERNFFHQPHNLQEKLQNLAGIPTLIVHGNGHDIPFSVARDIQATIANSSLAILESGHFPYIEVPNMLFSWIKAFSQAHAVQIAECINAPVF